MNSPAETVSTLGIHSVVGELRAALEKGNAVLEAEPGAGKSTGVPLALLDCTWLAGQQILMLEPRRLAARAVSERLAGNLGETLGQSIGLATRDERVGSAACRIEVITEGLLTRRLQRDPELRGVGLVVFDEFHERSLQSDLALALCLDCQDGLRPDLRVLLMSATVDRAALKLALPDVPIIHCAGRQYPVDVIWCAQPARGALPAAVASTVAEALRSHDGDILVFLPGMREIRQTERLVSAQQSEHAEVLTLHGSLAIDSQRAVLAPGQRRRIVLASAIAETSITLPGVRVVIDAGLERRAEFDHRTGTTALRTVEASQASATQRAGRAGRTASGWCYRLWGQAAHVRRATHWEAEIGHTDLSDLLLQLRAWGVRDEAALCWLDPPPKAQLVAAQSMLLTLGALDLHGRVTPDGILMASLGLPVTLSALALQGWRHGCGQVALALAVALAESPQGESDSTDHAQRSRQRPASKRLLKRLQSSLSKVAPGSVLPFDAVLLRVFRDRVAELSDHRDNRYRLSSGSAAFLADQDRLCGSQVLVVFAMAGAGRTPRITRARQLDLDVALTALPEMIDSEDVVSWDAQREQVVAERRQSVGAITLRVDPLPQADDEAVCAALLEAVRDRGLRALQWGEAESQLQNRVALLRQLDGAGSDTPPFDDESLLADLGHWLGPQLIGIRRFADCRRIDLAPLLLSRLSWPIRERLDALLPTRWRVPSGRSVALKYADAGVTLEVKLQELFGLRESPRVANGRVAVTVHLLSPARRPLAVTSDLESFWSNGYRDVRKQMRGRYPKHPWPEDPLTAEPTAYTKSRAAGKGGQR